jgi:predicted PurR-regulated permease PerM
LYDLQRNDEHSGKNVSSLRGICKAMQEACMAGHRGDRRSECGGKGEAPWNGAGSSVSIRQALDAPLDNGRFRTMRATESYVRPIVIGVAIVALAYTLFQLADVLILVFGAVVIASILLAMAELIKRVRRMPDLLAYSLALVLFAGVIAAAGWLAGARLAQEIGQVFERLPQAIDAARRWIASVPLGNLLLEALRGTTSSSLQIGRVAGLTHMTMGAFSGVLVTVLGGIYLGANPRPYRVGLLRLIPAQSRNKVDDALRDAGKKLRQWLLGQLVLMGAVGVLSAIGLTLLGVPGAVGLGFLATILEFVPVFGPVLFGAIAILVAFAQGPQQALYVLLLTLAVQQLESHVLVPLVNRWATSLPPALAVTSIVAFGLLFGVPGIMFAVPLAIVIVSLVNSLYVKSLSPAGADARGAAGTAANAAACCPGRHDGSRVRLGRFA